MYSKKNKNSGFTLIELIVTMVVMGIVSTIFVYLLVSIFGTLQENQVRKQLLMDGYNATTKFVREFELINNESNFLLGQTDQIQFNTIIGGTITTINYQIVGNELQRSVDLGAPVTLCTNVTGQFDYYQKDHFNMPPPLGPPNRLKTRHVRLTLNMLDDQGNQKYTYVADAFPENYRFSGGGS